MGVNENGRLDESDLPLTGAIPEEQARGPMAHEVTIISADRGVEVGVVEGNDLRVTARPAGQPAVEQADPARRVTGTLTSRTMLPARSGDSEARTATSEVSRAGHFVSAVIADTAGREVYAELASDGSIRLWVHHPDMPDFAFTFNPGGLVIDRHVSGRAD